MNKAHIDINWENYPSDETPLNESNLNKMDAWEYYEIANISNTDVNLNNYN